MTEHVVLPLDGFLYAVADYGYVGTSGRGGKLLPPAANAALNASPGVNARRARHDFTIVQTLLSSKDVRVEVALGNRAGVDFLREGGMRGHHRSEESATVIRKIETTREVEQISALGRWMRTP